jgi:hypothetical protein
MELEFPQFECRDKTIFGAANLSGWNRISLRLRRLPSSGLFEAGVRHEKRMVDSCTGGWLGCGAWVARVSTATKTISSVFS